MSPSSESTAVALTPREVGAIASHSWSVMLIGARSWRSIQVTNRRLIEEARSRNRMRPRKAIRKRRAGSGRLLPAVSPSSSSWSTTRPLIHDWAIGDLTGGDIDYRDGLVGAGPADSARSPSQVCRRKNGWGRLHDNLLAASPVGRHPVPGWIAPAGSLTDRRSMTLSPVDDLRYPGKHRAPRKSRRTSKRQASTAMTQRHPWCIGRPPGATGSNKVHQ